MAILKADIETFINSCMEADISSADLSEAIKLCMADLANIGLLVGADTSQTLSDGDFTLDYPDEYKDLLSIQLTDDSDNIEATLMAMSGGHEEYRNCMSSSTTTGTPEYYSEYNGKFYLYPPPDTDYEVNIEYQKYDDKDPDNIEFGDEFANALKFGSVYFHAMMKGRERYIKLWGQNYFNEKEMRRLNFNSQPYITE